MLIGGLTAASVALAMLYWTLLVRPHLVLSALFTKDSDADGHDSFGWPDPDPSTLRAARWAAGGVLVCVSFMCGATTTFLLAT
jgi:hypothetical protein